MDVIVVFNGLGNQMSQYAFYLAKKRYVKNCRLIFSPASNQEHNGSELEKLFSVKYKYGIIEICLRILYKYYDGIPRIRKYFHKVGIRVIRENQNYDYDISYLQKKTMFGINFYEGGWHSEKYFKSIRAEIKKNYSFNISNEDEEFKKVYEAIYHDETSISIHIRRGDYCGHPDFEGIANVDYYKKAMNYWRGQMKYPHFYIFSNDIGLCKKWFDDSECTFIDINKGKDAWRDMFLMSVCKYHIIANSTFSWWGAWLSYEKDNTVCPSEFMNNRVTKDIYPKTWIKI